MSFWRFSVEITMPTPIVDRLQVARPLGLPNTALQ